MQFSAATLAHVARLSAMGMAIKATIILGKETSEA